MRTPVLIGVLLMQGNHPRLGMVLQAADSVPFAARKAVSTICGSLRKELERNVLRLRHTEVAAKFTAALDRTVTTRSGGPCTHLPPGRRTQAANRPVLPEEEMAPGYSGIQTSRNRSRSR